MLTRPNFTKIYSNLYTDITTALGSAYVNTKSIIGAFCLALSRTMDSVYSYCDSVFKQSVPYTATGSDLEAWSALMGCISQSGFCCLGNWNHNLQRGCYNPCWIGLGRV